MEQLVNEQEGGRRAAIQSVVAQNGETYFVIVGKKIEEGRGSSGRADDEHANN